MNKVFTLAPNENWIVDRFVKEWNEDNADIVAQNINSADVIWLFADWCFNQVPQHILKTKKVITTIHHIVPEKFGTRELQEFSVRDSFTHVYHVPNVHTLNFIKPLTSKQIHIIPYWANQKIWYKTKSKEELRQKYQILECEYAIGSFQRDTEGAGLNQGIANPKLEKGPDLLAEYISKLNVNKQLHVILGGWRRQYLIERLRKANVKYTYIELPSQETINDLYQTLDIYPITARYEGGPQSLLECGLLNIPVVSRPIGMAEQVLPPESINDDVSLAVPNIPNVKHLTLPNGYKPYRELIGAL